MNQSLKEKFINVIKNPFVIAGIVFGLLIIIIVGFVVHNLWEDANDGKITVVNLDSYIEKAPAELRDDIYKSVFDIAKLNSSDLDDTAIASSSASIRENTFNTWYNARTGIKRVEFIVDIPKIAQNYKMQYEWKPNNKKEDLGLKRTVSCLKPDEYAYKFYPCLNLNDDRSRPQIGYLNNILPYSGVTTSDAAIYARQIEYTTGGDPFLRVDVNSCGKQAVLDDGVKIVKEYIDKYLNSEDYAYKASDLCDGEAH